MAAATAAGAGDAAPGGGPAAVRLPRSPPFKVLAEQLRRDTEGSPGAWRLSRAAAGREPLELVTVWMQGTVVAADGGEARLRDPSGAFSVCGLERVPRGRPCLVPGNGRTDPGCGRPGGRGLASPLPRYPSFLFPARAQFILLISLPCSPLRPCRIQALPW